MESNNNRCGFCINFVPRDDDIFLIPVGTCSNITNSKYVDFHRNECSHFNKKPGLTRTINCNGCNFELWPDFSCTCSRNYTSNIDLYQKAS